MLSAQRRMLVLLLVVSIFALSTQVAMATDSLPFKGSDIGTFGVPGPCGNGVNVLIEGVGTATHTGRYAYFADECFDPATGLFSGTALFTASNGDQFWGNYSGRVAPTSDPTIITYVETLVITGGSGRFLDAEGELQADGVANLGTGDYHQQLRGHISNLGLGRSS